MYWIPILMLAVIVVALIFIDGADDTVDPFEGDIDLECGLCGSWEIQPALDTPDYRCGHCGYDTRARIPDHLAARLQLITRLAEVLVMLEDQLDFADSGDPYDASLVREQRLRIEALLTSSGLHRAAQRLFSEPQLSRLRADLQALRAYLRSEPVTVELDLEHLLASDRFEAIGSRIRLRSDTPPSSPS